MLDGQLLRDFMAGFYGYGHVGATYWLIGLEEGGGASIDEIQHRLETWNALGRPELADLQQFHSKAGFTRWFGIRPPLQATWKQLIRTVLAADGQPADIESIRNYQRDLLGRRAGRTALIELMPLPSASTSSWLYAEAGLDVIRDRERYSAAVLEERIAAIRRLIGSHQPQVVIFYGVNRRQVWTSIAGGAFVASDDEDFWFHSTQSTLFLMTRHPAARGARNEEFESAGRFVRSRPGRQL
jgi:hypothetical protein